MTILDQVQQWWQDSSSRPKRVSEAIGWLTNLAWMPSWCRSRQAISTLTLAHTMTKELCPISIWVLINRTDWQYKYMYNSCTYNLSPAHTIFIKYYPSLHLGHLNLPVAFDKEIIHPWRERDDISGNYWPLTLVPFCRLPKSLSRSVVIIHLQLTLHRHDRPAWANTTQPHCLTHACSLADSHLLHLSLPNFYLHNPSSTISPPSEFGHCVEACRGQSAALFGDLTTNLPLEHLEVNCSSCLPYRTSRTSSDMASKPDKLMVTQQQPSPPSMPSSNDMLHLRQTPNMPWATLTSSTINPYSTPTFQGETIQPQTSTIAMWPPRPVVPPPKQRETSRKWEMRAPCHDQERRQIRQCWRESSRKRGKAKGSCQNIPAWNDGPCWKRWATVRSAMYIVPGKPMVKDPRLPSRLSANSRWTPHR